MLGRSQVGNHLMFMLQEIKLFSMVRFVKHPGGQEEIILKNRAKWDLGSMLDRHQVIPITTIILPMMIITIITTNKILEISLFGNHLLLILLEIKLFTSARFV